MVRSLYLLSAALPLLAANSVQPGRFIVEPPTLENMGFEWDIAGDDNRNATVEVRFREAGASAWRPALPLLRIGGEMVYRRRENLEYIVPHGFAGSILNVKPGTEYECEFTMKDPDGVEGQAVQVHRVRTRVEPQPYTGGRTLHVYPPDYKGTRLEPSFTGIMQAYYGAGLGDWNMVWERKVQPGDVILVHAGMYKSDRWNYVDPLMAPFDGTYLLTLKGTAERPITIKAAGDGEVIFDGAGTSRLFDIMATEHHIFDGLAIRNADIAFFAGQKNVIGAKGLTIRNCRMENVGMGIYTEFAGSTNFFLSDNVILGRDDRTRLIGWSNPGIYGAHELRSYYGIKVYGSGHVIQHNSVAYFHDAIGVSTYGTPEADRLLRGVSIDILENDMHVLGDDYVETDGGVHNIRVMRNRGVNAAHGGYSSQPVFGGPAYFVRNLLYHVWSGVAFKLSAKPAGIYLFHNTIVGEHIIRDPYSNSHFRNNLFLGTDRTDRGVATFAHATSYSSNDYNGFRPNRGVTEQYSWLWPKAGQRLYEPEASDWKTFPTLAALREATGQERHGIEVDFDIFERMKAPDPAARHAIYHAMDLNFRLNPKGKAVDAGVALATVNDGFAGKAPDLGALEAGQPEPHYGARWIKQPFYR